MIHSKLLTARDRPLTQVNTFQEEKFIVDATHFISPKNQVFQIMAFQM